MTLRTIARYGAVAIGLALAGFVGTIGTLTFVFSPKLDSYAPTGSSDAAAWVQAAGSIVAIAASYWLGERQARKAREQALEVYDLQRRRVEAGARGIVGQLYGEVLSINQSATEFDFVQFKKTWDTYLRYASQAALDAFDNMPLHEMGTAARVRSAFELRSMLQHELGQIDAITGRALEIPSSLSAEEMLEAATTNEYERIQKIRKLAKNALDRQTLLRDSFYRSYME